MGNEKNHILRKDLNEYEKIIESKKEDTIDSMYGEKDE